MANKFNKLKQGTENMTARKNIRDVVSTSDLLITVGLLKRIFKKGDVNVFLTKIDDPEELDRLYDALAVLVGYVDGKPAVEPSEN